jgi:hypothetical protein
MPILTHLKKKKLNPILGSPSFFELLKTISAREPLQIKEKISYASFLYSINQNLIFITPKSTLHTSTNL